VLDDVLDEVLELVELLVLDDVLDEVLDDVLDEVLEEVLEEELLGGGSPSPVSLLQAALRASRAAGWCFSCPAATGVWAAGGPLLVLRSSVPSWSSASIDGTVGWLTT